MIEAAWEVLQEKGCEAATVNDIIARSGGSRSTLYEAFGGKDGLFEAAVAERCAAFGEAMQLVLDDRKPPRDVLLTFANAFLEKIHAPESERTMAIFCAEGGRFPELIETFLHHGPHQLGARITRYLADAAEAGRLEIDDPEMAADLFLSMLQGQWALRIAPELAPKPTPESLRRRAAQTVALFLDGLRPRTADGRD